MADRIKTITEHKIRNSYELLQCTVLLITDKKSPVRQIFTWYNKKGICVCMNVFFLHKVKIKCAIMSKVLQKTKQQSKPATQLEMVYQKEKKIFIAFRIGLAVIKKLVGEVFVGFKT